MLSPSFPSGIQIVFQCTIDLQEIICAHTGHELEDKKLLHVHILHNVIRLDNILNCHLYSNNNNFAAPSGQYVQFPQIYWVSIFKMMIQIRVGQYDGIYTVQQ